jgi:hypothetical protein
MSNSHYTSAFIASTFSLDILRRFCFLGFTCGWTCSLCSITSLLTPTRSEVNQAKTSLFLSRNCRSSTYSHGLIAVPMLIALSNIMGSSGTLLKSPSALIAFLNSVEASCLDEGCTCSCCSVSCLRKCRFLWPGAKPHSMFLASF